MKMIEYKSVIYINQKIDLIFGGKYEIMVNCSQIETIFNKSISDFLKDKSIIEFIKSLEETPLYENTKPLRLNQIIDFNNKDGIFMQRNLALKFISGTHPSFEVWFMKTIDSLLFDFYRKIYSDIIEKIKLEEEMEKVEKQLLDNKSFVQLKILELEEKIAQLIEIQKKID